MARFLRGGGGRRGGGGDDMQMNLFSALGGGEGVRLEQPEKIELGSESIRMVLPRAEQREPAGGTTPPEVAAEVRRAFSGDAKRTDGPTMVIPGEKVTVGRAGSVMEGKPLPPTGVFRRPEPEEQGPEAPLDEGDEGKGAVWEDEEEGMPWVMRARAWLAGMGWSGSRWWWAGGAAMLVALLAVWSARGCGGGREEAGPVAVAETEFAAEATAGQEVAQLSSPEYDALSMDAESGKVAAAETGGEAASAESKPQEGAVEKASGGGTGAALPAWNIPGVKAEARNGSYFLVFDGAVFESKDAISVEGMRAIRALAAKLKTLEGGATVTVKGHTDNQPLTRPTAQFASNEDIAMARATAAAEHLKAFAKNKGLEFVCEAGGENEGPYPNDTPANRKKNRTVTITVTPK